jgi:N-acetylglucosaminyl-diphospho-decaprenol L-rhamnosyltransferase
MAPIYQALTSGCEVEVISGACLMIKRDVYDYVGQFNVEYFMYAEDADLCHKVIKAGWKNYYVPAATVVHFGGGSSKKATSDFSAVMMRDSIWRYCRLNRGEFYAACYRVSMCCAASCRLMLLGIVYPLQWFRGQGEQWLGSIRKWLAVFIWSTHIGAAFAQGGDIEPTTLRSCRISKIAK